VSGRGRRIETSFATAGVTRVADGAPPADRKQGSASSAIPVLFALTVVGVLAYAFLHRDENWFTPDRGLGYVFGIIGSVMMLILLTYPLRKRSRAMRGLGRLPGWLKFHMVLGILGPAFILFHANFRLGATNSNVALLTMLTVMGSGIVGRYIYAKTHNRLSGELRSLQALRAEAQAARTDAHFDFTQVPELRSQFDDVEAHILDPEHGVLSSTWLYFDFMLSKGGYRRRIMRVLKAAIKVDAARRGLEPTQERARIAQASQYVSAYLDGLQRAAEFRFYERMFALWHVLHVPLLFLLIAAAIVHVAAVHLY
jgi:hypothetical protein